MLFRVWLPLFYALSAGAGAARVACAPFWLQRADNHLMRTSLDVVPPAFGPNDFVAQQHGPRNPAAAEPSGRTTRPLPVAKQKERA